nr:GNAT family N-acetyltransferase [Arsenicicoccus dermatophilus]
MVPSSPGRRGRAGRGRGPGRRGRRLGARPAASRVPGPSTPTGVDVLLSSVATAPGRRRQGHARACVEAVLAWARERGADRVELFATAEAVGLYEELGFRRADHPALRAALVL